MKVLDDILNELAELVSRGKFKELETDRLEIKPVPASGGDWKERYKSINAFLNTRGGFLVLGIKEEGAGRDRRYVFTGWQEYAEPNLKEIPKLYTNRKGGIEDLTSCFPPFELRSFLQGRIAIVYVDELPADRKFVFYNGEAYKRILTGDHKISLAELEAQEEYKEEAVHARELQPVPSLAESDLDLEKLNRFIYELNQPAQVETMKADLAQARSFLERKSFMKNGAVTVLGALVCARHPGDYLGFRCHLHGYVDVPSQTNAGDNSSQVVHDKQDFVDNVLQLMESGLSYLQRNIQVGISPQRGGESQPQYPIKLLRETINNALAHRDYLIDRQVILQVHPGERIEVRNPGTFRAHLLIQNDAQGISIRRILPEPKPRNPKLADVLRVFRKWEGRGIGMATLVNYCLENQIDLPYYRLHSEEVCLSLCAGRLLDERMKRLFDSFDGYIESKLQGNALNDEQKLVLAYLMKSEWANEEHRYTILLTPDNNHINALVGLEHAGLAYKHPASTSNYPVYIADRVLMSHDHLPELRQWFGLAFDSLKPLLKSILGVVYRFNRYNKAKLVSAKQASYLLWYEKGGHPGGIEQFDTFYRQVRYAFNRLEKGLFVIKAKKAGGYELNSSFRENHLL